MIPFHGKRRVFLSRLLPSLWFLRTRLLLVINRRRDRIKILFWDRDGLCIWYKRLEVGTFQSPSGMSDAQGIELDYSQLAMLLGGIDLRSARQRKRYRRAG
jgi:transposase